jgi:predicted transcriptional regulator
MVWRIHFTADDLARIQVGPTLGPLAETVKALSLLQCPMQSRTLFGAWRAQVQGNITPRMAPLLAMMPADTMSVDLCTLTGAAATIELGIQALLAVPREHLLVEMEYTNRYGRLPSAAWAMAEIGAREPLADATQAAYQALVQPYWPRIHARLHAEHVARSRTLAYSGADRLLASLQSQRVRWRPPVLEILMPTRRDLYLAGRGITLVPSVFVGKDPGLHENPNDERAAPVLMLPAADDGPGHAQLWDRPRPPGTALSALVGRNRAAVLGSIAGGCTTTELAGRAGISLAAASQHASVLRDAGLIITRRQGRAVLHVLTPLGTDLLQAG